MITFGVSVPGNGKDMVSGYRLFTFQNDKLAPLPVILDNATDRNVMIQKFCYLKPKDRIITPECQNGGLMDSSDYLLVAKSNGIIEIFRDYRYKVTQDIELKPDFILTCLPVGHDRSTLDLTIAGLEFKDGLLYCCTKDGDLYIFILNLPTDYIQLENIYNPIGTPDVFDIAAPNMRDSNKLEEGILFVYSKFTGRTKLQHICYYCHPMGQQISIYPQLKVLYPNIPYFKPCIYVNLKKEVSNFRINPLDRFSFITTAPRIPLTIYKIHLPKLFTDFFIKFVKLKRTVLKRCPREIQDIDEASTSIYSCKFLDFLRFDFRGIQTDMDPRTWNSLMTNDYVVELTYSCVWRQRQGNIKDDLYMLFHRQAEMYDDERERPTSRGSLTGSTDSSVRSNSLRRSIWERTIDAAPCYSNSATDRFIRCLRQNTCPVDIKIVNTKLGSEQLSYSNVEDEQGSNRTSYLTDDYKDMDIIILDKFLCLTAFRPKYIDEPLMKLDSFHSIREGNTNLEAQWAIMNLSSFKKFFMITNSLCLIFDTFGVVLIDRFKVVNSHDLLENDPEAFKIIDFEIGLINDIAVIITNIEKCEECDGTYEIEFNAIVTTVIGTLSVLHGEFYGHERLGKMHCRDKLKMTKKDKVVDQIVLLDYEPSKKRTRKEEMDDIAKRLRVGSPN
ncbi:Gid12p Ecym_8032 [Eremothecium cymbalariae DBVPG|uniref:Uncharacterized protein n=1 Tax=Eremothecium cymbalariae (strain CBS 270.75 / DBVPG 7215 / KCTC 17166 / NRRL Y-17582) TaxID=931890 RepID=G8JWV4_ERECY|nr:Hypothetical protein Ecym_8032 [Eremothecium cymbalariae DBVPG\